MLSARHDQRPQEKLSRSKAYLNPEQGHSIGRDVTKEMGKALELLFRHEQVLEKFQMN